MKQDVIPVLDCGATNVRAMAVDRQGNIIARAATANASDIAAEKKRLAPVVAGGHYAALCRLLSADP